jgi:small GTP-binding protein
MTKRYKIVISGPFAAGKTTFVQAVTEIAPVATEAKTTALDESSVKDATTVAMDFGRITLDGENVLHIFGTPGQFRFNYMWSILGKDALGVIVVVNPVAKEAFEDAQDIISYFRVKTDVPIVVALNHFGGHEELSRDEIRQALSIPKWIHIVDCDAHDKESVRNVLLVLLQLVKDETYSAT